VKVQENEEQTIKMMQVQMPCGPFAGQTVSVSEIDLSQIGARYECMEVESESEEDDEEPDYLKKSLGLGEPV